MKIIPANQLENRLSVGMTYTFPNGNVMTLALTREPGRATWIKRRDYAFNDNELYWRRTAYDAEGRPTETEDSLTATRQWLYNKCKGYGEEGCRR